MSQYLEALRQAMVIYPMIVVLFSCIKITPFCQDESGGPV